MQRKGDCENVTPKRGFGEHNFNMAGKTNQLEERNSEKTVPRGVIYCCVPHCHSYDGKIADDKKVQLHRIPKDTKTRRLWIAKLPNVRKYFASKPATRVCSLHFEGRNGPKPWCLSPTLFSSKPRFPSRKRPLPDRTRGEATLHSKVSASVHSELNFILGL